MFCYIPVKVRKLLDMGFLIKMIISASARCFKSENPTVQDLVKDGKLAAPPKFNHKRIMLIIHLGFIPLRKTLLLKRGSTHTRTCQPSWLLARLPRGGLHPHRFPVDEADYAGQD